MPIPHNYSDKVINNTANRIWKNWALSNLELVPFGQQYFRPRWNLNVANEANRGSKRERFESWLLEQGCYLEVKNGEPFVKGFDEQSLIMLLLHYG